MIINQNELNSCLSGKIGCPHDFLGLHSLGSGIGVVARAFDPEADEIVIVDQNTDAVYPLKKIHSNGFFEGHITEQEEMFPYLFRSIRAGNDVEWFDPYGFLPFKENKDFTAFNDGTDRRPFEKLGSFPYLHHGVEGVAFLVWAPSAQSVHLVGDFNNWHPF